MKRSLALIGYVAGVLEKRGYLPEVPPHSMLFFHVNQEQAKHLAKIFDTKPFKRKNRDGYVIRLQYEKAIQWLMTVYPLVSPPIRERIEHAIVQWKSRNPTKWGRCKEPERHGKMEKQFCRICYQREWHRRNPSPLRGKRYLGGK